MNSASNLFCTWVDSAPSTRNLLNVASSHANVVTFATLGVALVTTDVIFNATSKAAHKLETKSKNTIVLYERIILFTHKYLPDQH